MNFYSIENLANREWKEFAIYSGVGRHIPSMIDGLKPSQRFFLASSLDDSRTNFEKVAAISGSVARYGYKHGEDNAGGAGVGMAQTWVNNACLIQGRGSFGTRLVPKAASIRYIYSRIHPNFDKMVKDLDLVPPSKDPEIKIPMHYIPVVPLLLVNGADGIATGFRSLIYPRAMKDVIRACAEYLKTGKIKNRLIPFWNDYKGTVEEVEPGKYRVRGTFTRQGKTGLEITEVPIGFTRETYVSLLDDLEDEGLISGYVDSCGKSGFHFKVQLRRGSDMTDDDIVNMFKLSKPISETLTAVDATGNLKVYNSLHEIIAEFCDYRKAVLQRRIDTKREESREEARFYRVKAEFIRRVLDSKIVFKNKTKIEVAQQIMKIKEAVTEDVDRLLRINLLSLTKEMIDELVASEAKVNEAMAFWEKETPDTQFASDLLALSKA